MNQDKEKMLKITTDQIESKFGRGSIMKLEKVGPISLSASYRPERFLWMLRSA